MSKSVENKIKQVYAIQEYYIHKSTLGLPRIRIYDNVARLFPISISTFDRYLARNVRKEISDLRLDINELNKYKDDVIKAIQELEEPFIFYKRSENY